MTDIQTPYIVTVNVSRSAGNGNSFGVIIDNPAVGQTVYTGLSMRKHYYRANSLQRLEGQNLPGQTTKEKQVFFADMPFSPVIEINDRFTIETSATPAEVGEVFVVTGVRLYALTAQFDTYVLKRQQGRAQGGGVSQ